MPPTLTPYYQWPIPDENTDPWFGAFDTLVAAQDLTVRSVGTLAPTHTTLVLSVYPAGATAYPAPLPAGTAPSTWYVVSAAPFGPAQGSFRLVSSGAWALFALTLSGWAEGGPQFAVSTRGLWQYWRLVVNPFSYSIPSGQTAVTSEPGWGLFWNALARHQRVGLIAAVPLGPGAYSVQLQTQGWLVPQTAATSRWIMDVFDHAALWVTDVVWGG